MNKYFKIFIAITGAVNIIFSMFIPIAISLVVAKIYSLNGFSLYILIVAGWLCTIYRAIDVAGIDTIEYIFNSYKNGKRKGRNY